MQAVMYFLLILFLLFISGILSSAEVAFFSLSPVQLKKMREANMPRTNIIMALLSKPKRLLGTLLIANNLANIAIIILSSYLTLILFDFSGHKTLGFIIQVVMITFIIVLLAEVMPKVYATHHTIGFAQNVAWFIYALDKLLKPLTWLLVSSTSLIDRKMTRKKYDVTAAELTHAIDITSDSTTHAEEKKMLKGIVHFGNIDVRQIMKHRMDVVAFDSKTPFTKLLSAIMEAGYSRLPVYEETFDKIVGVLYIKDLIAHLGKGDEFEWQKLLRPPFFVPESKKINDLMEEFQEKKIHLAVVIDEYGGNLGIVTLEDILEEIVGELSDEFDDDEPLYSKLDDNNYVFEAKTLVNDVCRVMNIDRSVFNEIEGETDTLAGLLLEMAGRIPEKNQKINYKNFLFTIESSDRKRIKRVKITREVSQEKEEEQDKRNYF